DPADVQAGGVGRGRGADGEAALGRAGAGHLAIGHRPVHSAQVGRADHRRADGHHRQQEQRYRPGPAGPQRSEDQLDHRAVPAGIARTTCAPAAAATAPSSTRATTPTSSSDSGRSPIGTGSTVHGGALTGSPGPASSRANPAPSTPASTATTAS